MNTFPGAQYLIVGIFVLFIAATVAGALLAALATRVIRGVCGLALCCIGLAGLYYFLHSPFLAMMEILIYVGAVCVTIIFAVMLADPDETKSADRPGKRLLWGISALVVSGVIFWGLTRLNLQEKWVGPKEHLNQGSVQDIGMSLLTTYSLAFEMISLVLLVAIIGALAIARTGRKQT